ncbi:V-type ATP synthase subunit I [Nanoarchaeota archaeon]
MVTSSSMQKIEIIGLNQDKLKILAELQNLGVLQITQLPEEITNELTRSEPEAVISEVSENLTKISRIKSALDLVKTKKTFAQNVLSLDLPKTVKVERLNTKKLMGKANVFFKQDGNEIIKLDEQYYTSLEKIKELKDQRKVAEILSHADAPLYLMRDTKNMTINFGVVENKILTKLRDDLRETTKGLSKLILLQKEGKFSTILVLCFKAHSEQVSSILKKNKFVTLTLPDVPAKKTDVLSYVDGELAKLEKTITEIKSQLKKFKNKIYKEVVVLREELEIEEEKQKVVHKLAESKSVFITRGWVEEEKLVATAKKLSLLTHHNISIRRIEKDKHEEPPVKMKNRSWLKPFEMLTELYALPKYKDIDPTFIVGPVFVIFAGFMLTDFVYGLGLVLLGGFMLLKLVKHAEGLKGMSINILLMGLVSMLFGFLTGSYLGDGLKVLLEKLGMMTAEQYANTFVIWNDPLADPLYFLVLSIIVALVHINIGLIIGAIEDIRKKQIKNLLTSRVVWIVLQLSVLFFYLGMTIPAVVLILVVVGTIIYAEGPIGILGITGFMGDVISYSRLFALALSTAGIAMTVNLLTTLVIDIPYAGIIAAIIIFVGGHMFSFLMNSLGSFVHSIRLQFVEFFGKFYEGGGDKFEPFVEKRKYTILKSRGKNG